LSVVTMLIQLGILPHGADHGIHQLILHKNFVVHDILLLEIVLSDNIRQENVIAICQQIFSY
jgi:hypothetical protein